MSDITCDPAAHIPLSDLAFHVLLALGAGAQHGYAIGKEIERRTEGRLSPATGSLYQVLRRLHRDGLITDVDRRRIMLGTDARRQYFQLTRFGKKVFQLEAARLLVYRAASKLDRSRNVAMDAAMAKLFVGEAYAEIALRTLQTLGGYGYCTEYEVERSVRDALGARIYSGTSEMQRNIVARWMGL